MAQSLAGRTAAARLPRARLQVVAALLAVWIIWGATYVGIRVAVETIPPFVASSSRFLLAAAVLAGLVALRRGPRALLISRRQLTGCTAAGSLLLGSVAMMMVAERDVPSNLAALIGSGTACWVVVARLALRGRVPTGTLVGVPLGLVGLATVLILGRGGSVHASGLGLLAALVSSWLWTAGSVVSPRLALPRDMLVTSTWESLAGGLIMLPLAGVTGELGSFRVSEVSGRSFGAWLFLALAGSVLAFTAYAWLLANVSISTAVTNQYVNPIVALALGWLLLGEHLSASMLVGGSMVIGAVVLIVRAEARDRAAVVAADAPA